MDSTEDVDSDLDFSDAKSHVSEVRHGSVESFQTPEHLIQKRHLIARDAEDTDSDLDFKDAKSFEEDDALENIVESPDSVSDKVEETTFTIHTVEISEMKEESESLLVQKKTTVNLNEYLVECPQSPEDEVLLEREEKQHPKQEISITEIDSKANTFQFSLPKDKVLEPFSVNVNEVFVEELSESQQGSCDKVEDITEFRTENGSQVYKGKLSEKLEDVHEVRQRTDGQTEVTELTDEATKKFTSKVIDECEHQQFQTQTKDEKTEIEELEKEPTKVYRSQTETGHDISSEVSTNKKTTLGTLEYLDESKRFWSKMTENIQDEEISKTNSFHVVDKSQTLEIIDKTKSESSTTETSKKNSITEDTAKSRTSELYEVLDTPQISEENDLKTLRTELSQKSDSSISECVKDDFYTDNKAVKSLDIGDEKNVKLLTSLTSTRSEKDSKNGKEETEVNTIKISDEGVDSKIQTSKDSKFMKINTHSSSLIEEFSEIEEKSEELQTVIERKRVFELDEANHSSQDISSIEDITDTETSDTHGTEKSASRLLGRSKSEIKETSKDLFEQISDTKKESVSGVITQISKKLQERSKSEGTFSKSETTDAVTKSYDLKEPLQEASKEHVSFIEESCHVSDSRKSVEALQVSEPEQNENFSQFLATDECTSDYMKKFTSELDETNSEKLVSKRQTVEEMGKQTKHIQEIERETIIDTGKSFQKEIVHKVQNKSDSFTEETTRTLEPSNESEVISFSPEQVLSFKEKSTSEKQEMFSNEKLRLKDGFEAGRDTSLSSSVPIGAIKESSAVDSSDPESFHIPSTKLSSTHKLTSEELIVQGLKHLDDQEVKNITKKVKKIVVDPISECLHTVQKHEPLSRYSDTEKAKGGEETDSLDHTKITTQRKISEPKAITQILTGPVDESKLSDFMDHFQITDLSDTVGKGLQDSSETEIIDDMGNTVITKISRRKAVRKANLPLDDPDKAEELVKHLRESESLFGEYEEEVVETRTIDKKGNVSVSRTTKMHVISEPKIAFKTYTLGKDGADSHGQITEDILLEPEEIIGSKEEESSDDLDSGGTFSDKYVQGFTRIVKQTITEGTPLLPLTHEVDITEETISGKDSIDHIRSRSKLLGENICYQDISSPGVSSADEDSGIQKSENVIVLSLSNLEKEKEATASHRMPTPSSSFDSVMREEIKDDGLTVKKVRRRLVGEPLVLDAKDEAEEKYQKIVETYSSKPSILAPYDEEKYQDLVRSYGPMPSLSLEPISPVCLEPTQVHIAQTDEAKISVRYMPSCVVEETTGQGDLEQMLFTNKEVDKKVEAIDESKIVDDAEQRYQKLVKTYVDKPKSDLSDTEKKYKELVKSYKGFPVLQESFTEIPSQMLKQHTVKTSGTTDKASSVDVTSESDQTVCETRNIQKIQETQEVFSKEDSDIAKLTGYAEVSDLLTKKSTDNELIHFTKDVAVDLKGKDVAVVVHREICTEEKVPITVGSTHQVSDKRGLTEREALSRDKASSLPDGTQKLTADNKVSQKIDNPNILEPLVCELDIEKSQDLESTLKNISTSLRPSDLCLPKQTVEEGNQLSLDESSKLVLESRQELISSDSRVLSCISEINESNAQDVVSILVKKIDALEKEVESLSDSEIKAIQESSNEGSDGMPKHDTKHEEKISKQLQDIDAKSASTISKHTKSGDSHFTTQIKLDTSSDLSSPESKTSDQNRILNELHRLSHVESGTPTALTTFELGAQLQQHTTEFDKSLMAHPILSSAPQKWEDHAPIQPLEMFGDSKLAELDTGQLVSESDRMVCEEPDHSSVRSECSTACQEDDTVASTTILKSSPIPIRQTPDIPFSETLEFRQSIHSQSSFSQMTADSGLVLLDPISAASTQAIPSPSIRFSSSADMHTNAYPNNRNTTLPSGEQGTQRTSRVTFASYSDIPPYSRESSEETSCLSYERDSLMTQSVDRLAYISEPYLTETEEIRKCFPSSADSLDDQAEMERCDMVVLLDQLSMSQSDLLEVRTEDEAPDIEECIASPVDTEDKALPGVKSKESAEKMGSVLITDISNLRSSFLQDESSHRSSLDSETTRDDETLDILSKSAFPSETIVPSEKQLFQEKLAHGQMKAHIDVYVKHTLTETEVTLSTVHLHEKPSQLPSSSAPTVLSESLPSQVASSDGDEIQVRNDFFLEGDYGDGSFTNSVVTTHTTTRVYPEEDDQVASPVSSNDADEQDPLRRSMQDILDKFLSGDEVDDEKK